MASINGVTIKSLKFFSGHEGEPLSQGTIYLNNKKLGFWSQDSHGGICDNFDFDDGLLVNPTLMWKHELKDYAYYQYLGIEHLLYVLVGLLDLEKNIKSQLKKGHKYILYSFSLTDGCWQCKSTNSEINANSFRPQLEEKVYKQTGNRFIVTDIFEANVSNLDLTIGSERGLKLEKSYLDNEKKRLDNERKKEEKERKDKEDRLINNGRFEKVDSENSGMVYIVDKVTGKKVEVTNHTCNSILDALIKLFIE